MERLDETKHYRPVKSAERAMRVIEELAGAPDKPSLPELHARVGYPRSSLYALVRTLRDLGWIEVDESGARFSVGTQALVSGTAYLDRDPALAYVARALEELRADVGHTVHYARRAGASVIYLASRESVVAVQEMYKVGRKLPAHTTALGQALLAELTSAEVDELLPTELTAFTRNSLTVRPALHTELEELRQRGWACEREQVTLGIACVACVVDYRIPATDAISCAMPSSLAAEEGKLDEIASRVKAHSDRLAATLRREGIR